MAFSPQQHTSLLRDGLDFVPESDFRYLPINVRLKLVELEKTNGQVYLPKNEAASLKREVAAEKMSEVAKRNDPDAYFGGDPEYSSTPITDDPAELKGRLGTDEYGTRPTIYRAIEPEGAVFNNRYLTSGQYESQYKESDPTIYGRYTPTKKGDEILLPPTASWLNPFADRINETEPHEYMHRGMMPTNWLSKYLLGPIDSISEKVGVGNLFGTRVFAGNQHTYIAKALAEDKQKKQMADFERQTSKLSERELAILKKYLESERNKLQLEKNRINKATGGVVDDDLPDVQPVQNNYVANPAAEEYYKKLAKRDRYFRENIMTIKDPEARDRKFAEYADFSVFKDILPFIPINVKQYAYHMAGGKGDVDINDLTKKEQEAYYRYAQEIMASGELPLDQDSSVMMNYSAYGTESDFGDIYWGKKNLGLSDEQFEAWKKGEIYITYPGGRNGAVESYSYEEFLEKYPGALDSDGQSIGDLITNMQDPNYVAKTFTGKADINYNKDSNTITVTDNYNHNRHPDATNKDIIEAFKADPSLYAALKAGAMLKNADGSVIELDLGSPEFVQSYPTGYANGDEAKSLSESEEYKRRLKKLENFISKNRLVSKEAQMSAMSEGSYKDPRFLNTTGHPLIDQYGMHPFPAEGSGQILSTTDLGMEGPESMFGRSLYGQYNPKEDTIIYKDLDKNIEGHKDYTSKEDTQKHELVHRTVRRSGWLDNFYNSPYLNDNAKLISGNKGKMLSPLINEALAHSYETLDKEELKKQIRFRASKFNLKEPDKIADEIFNNIEYLKNDFENHLEEINPNLTKYTRIKKATGGEANNLQAALDMLQKPVPNIIKAPEKKNKKKSSAAALIELEVDPVFRVPTNVKTFVDSVLLNKKDNITNKNFSNSELKVVKDLIVESANNKNVYTESLENPFNPLNYIPEGKKTSAKRAKMLDDMKGGDLTTPGYVDYNTYNKKTGLGSINSSPGFHSVFSDTGKVLTTLGQFNYSILPNGDVQVTDTYDFNPMLLDDQGQESKRANAFTNSELSVLSGGYYPLRKLGEKLLPEREGKGRKINIVLPKDLFSKEEYSSIKNLTNSRIKKATGGEANQLTSSNRFTK
jgi:hypothetical protein